MQNALIMRGFNAGADLSQQRERALHCDRAFASQKLIKGLTLDVFHHQKENAFFTLAKVGDRDDVVMLNRSGGARLAFEAGDRFAFLQVLIREHVRANGFHRDAPRNQIFIARQIHLAHRAAPQTLLQTITAIQQGRAGQSMFGL